VARSRGLARLAFHLRWLRGARDGSRVDGEGATGSSAASARSCRPCNQPAGSRGSDDGRHDRRDQHARNLEITIEGGRVRRVTSTLSALGPAGCAGCRGDYRAERARSGGAGEMGIPTAAPALANAPYAATGKRIRSLPIRPPGLSAAGRMSGWRRACFRRRRTLMNQVRIAASVLVMSLAMVDAGRGPARARRCRQRRPCRTSRFPRPSLGNGLRSSSRPTARRP
jgi:hypothetical protein